jgi:hypothetical protein
MKNWLGVLSAIIIGALLYLYNSKRTANIHTAKERFGITFNDERKNRHLPIIEDGWVIRRTDSVKTQWSHSAMFNKKDIPEHIWKTLYFKKSVLVAEEDAFNYDRGDSVGDRLIITSSLVHPDSIRCSFSRHYYRSYPPSESHRVGLDFADSVLRAWKFNDLYMRLNKTNPL